MKTLIIYFSMTGRTEKMAKTIASTLSRYEVTLFPVKLTLPGEFFEKIKTLEKYHGGEHSLLQTDLNSLDAGKYDLIMIGMPTTGGKPPNIYYDILSGLKNLKGKNVIVFGTSRIYRGQMLQEMKTGVEARGGRVINQKNFKGLFILGKRRAVKYARMINNLKTL